MLKVGFWYIICLQIRDVEAVEYFLLPLPALYKISRFRVCFQLVSSVLPRLQKFNRFRFHIPAPCFIKNASASCS